MEYFKRTRRTTLIKLESKDYMKMAHLVKSQNELSVLSVINDIMPGEIYVNNIDNPTVALIKTCECNLIAGSPNNIVFNSQVSSELDFWDSLTPDSSEWFDKIPTIHKNQFIVKYKRRHYILSSNKFLKHDTNLLDEYVLEKVDLTLLRDKTFENSEKLLKWAEAWGCDETFKKYGTGYLIRNKNTIVSWSLSDCSFKNKIAIGIHTDERYRKKGFGKIVVSATIEDCFAKGYEVIEWLCVDFNKGSKAIAEKLGFICDNTYFSFSSYPPVENLIDLSESEWQEWGEYLENASKTEDRLTWECLYAYIKSNNVEKTINIMTALKHKKITIDYPRFKRYIIILQTYGMCSNFIEKTWGSFLNENIHC